MSLFEDNGFRFHKYYEIKNIKKKPQYLRVRTRELQITEILIWATSIRVFDVNVNEVTPSMTCQILTMHSINSKKKVNRGDMVAFMIRIPHFTRKA